MVTGEEETLSVSRVPTKTLGLLWSTTGYTLLLSAALEIATGLLPVAIVYLTRYTLDSLAAVAQGKGGGVLRYSIALMLLQSGLGALTALFGAEQTLLQRKISEDVVLRLKRMIIGKSQKIPLSVLEQSHVQSMLSRLEVGGLDSPLSFFSSLVSCSRSTVSLLVYLTLLVRSSWVGAVATVLLLSLNLLLSNRLAVKQYETQVQQTGSTRRREYLGGLLLRPETAKEIRAYGLGEYLLSRWTELYVTVRTGELKQAFDAEAVTTRLHWIGALLTVGVTGSLLLSLRSGGLTLGGYISLTTAVMAAQGVAKELARSAGATLRSIRRSREVFTFLELPEEQPPAEGWKVMPLPLRSGIVCKNLSFAYPGTNRPVLSDINLHIRPGERVAMVGRNGAGKTTLIKCIMGLYTPTGGAVLYDDVPADAINPEELRRRVSVQFQDFTKYSLSVRENIAFGNVKRVASDIDVKAAADVAGASFIDGLPDHLDTVLDPSLNEGARSLSQGQWQALAIARVAYSDAEIMILDEPTASLDPVAEARLIEALDKITRNKTVLFITHRVNCLQLADRIVVLKDGHIVESGVHEDLLSLAGEYAQMRTAHLEHLSTIERGGGHFETRTTTRDGWETTRVSALQESYSVSSNRDGSNSGAV